MLSKSFYQKHEFGPFGFIESVCLADALINAGAICYSNCDSGFPVVDHQSAQQRSTQKFKSTKTWNRCHSLRKPESIVAGFGAHFPPLCWSQLKAKRTRADAQLPANPLPPSTNSLSSILCYACHIPCRELFVPSRCESPKKVCTLRKGKKIKHKGSELLCVSRSSFHSKTHNCRFEWFWRNNSVPEWWKQAHTHRHLWTVGARESLPSVIGGNLRSVKSSILAARSETRYFRWHNRPGFETQILNYRRRRRYLIEEVKV